MKCEIVKINKCALVVLIFLFIFSCSFPRIIFLKDPLTPEDHINLGVIYEKNGDLEAAINEYKKALPDLPVAFLYIGNIFFSKGEYNLAEEYYKKAINNDPFNADAYNNLAWLYYLKRENLDEAELLVVRAIKLNEKNKDIYIDTLIKIKELKKLAN